MAVTLSIKNVPAALVERLKRKAAMHKRSLQAEVIAILEEATSPARRGLMNFGRKPGD